MTAQTRICSRCGAEHPIEAFPTNISGDGYVSVRTWCRKCENRRCTEKAKKNKKMRARRQERVRLKKLTPVGALKERARQALRNAVRGGKVQKLPCEVCGLPKSEGHHDDYNRPLDVRWLCPKHHQQVHGH